MLPEVAQTCQIALQDLHHKLGLDLPLLEGQEVQKADLEGDDQLVQVVDLRAQVGAQKRLQRFLPGCREAQVGLVGGKVLVNNFDQSLDLKQFERLRNQLKRGTDQAFREVPHRRRQIGVATLAFRQNAERQEAYRLVRHQAVVAIHDALAPAR